MAKINTYETSSPVESADKWIGTNSDGSTKNFVASDVAEYVKSTNTIDINVILGNNTGVEAVPQQLSPADVTQMLNTFGSSLKGLAPASGGGTTSFLRADGTWVAPAGSGGTTTNSLVIKANSGASEGVNMYTFNGSTAKTLNIVPQTNVNIRTSSGQLDVSALDDITDVMASSHTLILGDQNVYMYGGTASRTLKIPENSSIPFPLGTKIWIFNLLDSSAGSVTLNCPAGGYLFGSGTNNTSSYVMPYNTGKTITKLNTDTWAIS
jgi:hypothetical protein